MRVLILGGTGHFGGRICRRLVGESNIELLVSSRSKESASRFAASLPGSNSTAVELDHQSSTFQANLAVLRPDVVIHTAGPFQDQDYRVAEACLACGSHYIDLADGRTFVEGFASHLDARAREKGVLLVTGASTLPGLSSTVVAELTDGWAQVDSIHVSIAPAQQTPRGLSTIAAVLSYCGKPFRVLSNGRWKEFYGWQSFQLHKYPGLGRRISAVCDVPDLQLFPERYPGIRTVIFRAALESKLEHVALWIFAFFVRVGAVENWGRHAKLFQGLSRISQRLGSDTGGMQVDVRGVGTDGKQLNSQWNLIARNNHGPEIPVSPALVLVRKLGRGTLSLQGAYPCFNLMSLDEFGQEVADLDIDWKVETGAVHQ